MLNFRLDPSIVSTEESVNNLLLTPFWRGLLWGCFRRMTGDEFYTGGTD